MIQDNTSERMREVGDACTVPHVCCGSSDHKMLIKATRRVSTDLWPRSGQRRQATAGVGRMIGTRWGKGGT